MNVFIDIDETICDTPIIDGKRIYAKAVPIKKNIAKANKLYDEGHRITYWTARGVTTGIDWTDLTKEQFEEWGVKYHDVRLDKPSYDIFIDDKNINARTWEML